MAEQGQGLVQLEPFLHQVGGHSHMFKFDENSLCKPLVKREHKFYQTLSKELKEFTPQYMGVIEVSCIEEEDGYTFMGSPLEIKQPRSQLTAGHSPESSGEGAQSDSDSESASSKSNHSIRVRKSGSIEVMQSKKRLFPDEDGSESADLSELNPWITHCHKRGIDKMKTAEANSSPQKFILLEDIASRFTLPCVLDLKMGTRVHGDDVSEEKKLRHSKRCEDTTSSSLGLRICGMQVYLQDKRCYYCQDKYIGRKLNQKGFKDTLYKFFHNGQEFRREPLEAILDQLRKLHDIIAKHHTFRFYSSSLLLMYEGYMGLEAHLQYDANDAMFVPPPSTSHSKDDPQCSGPYSSGSYDMATRSDSELVPCNPVDGSQPSMHPAHLKHKTAPTAVRMIDFAHSTHNGFHGDKTVHTGPDRGYLFGLENLMRMLEELKS